MRYEDLFIDAKDTVIQCMKLLNITSKQILFLVENGKLRASLTDGDIRRWILSGGDLNAEVSQVANYNPQCCSVGYISEAKHKLKEKHIKAIPIIDDDDNILDIIFDGDDDKTQHKDVSLAQIPVVIMAGGLGTRLYPYTKILPKALVPIKDVPISEHIMNEFARFGFNDFYMIINHKKGMIRSYFADADFTHRISFAEEDVFLGTGGGLRLIKDELRNTFILSNCDILIKADYSLMYQEHKKQNNLITIVCSAKEFVIPYGIVEIDDVGQINSLKEKPSMSFLTNTGCYIVEPEAIDYIYPEESIGFPDVIKRCRDNGERVGVYPISENAWYDMGQLEELRRMEEML